MFSLAFDLFSKRICFKRSAGFAREAAIFSVIKNMHRGLNNGDFSDDDLYKLPFSIRLLASKLGPFFSDYFRYPNHLFSDTHVGMDQGSKSACELN